MCCTWVSSWWRYLGSFGGLKGRMLMEVVSHWVWILDGIPPPLPLFCLPLSFLSTDEVNSHPWSWCLPYVRTRISRQLDGLNLLKKSVPKYVTICYFLKCSSQCCAKHHIQTLLKGNLWVGLAEASSAFEKMKLILKFQCSMNKTVLNLHVLVSDLLLSLSDSSLVSWLHSRRCPTAYQMLSIFTFIAIWG